MVTSKPFYPLYNLLANLLELDQEHVQILSVNVYSLIGFQPSALSIEGKIITHDTVHLHDKIDGAIGLLRRDIAHSCLAPLNNLSLFAL